jgi:hypothetical protein
MRPGGALVLAFMQGSVAAPDGVACEFRPRSAGHYAREMSRAWVTFFTFLVAWGCHAEGERLPPSAQAPTPDYRPVTSVLQVMEWILDPAADLIWDSAGFIITAQGETDLQPRSEAGWDGVRNGAAVVAEAGNLLMMPGRSGGRDWDAQASRLSEAGLLALKAAEAHDAEALFAAGGQVYEACRGCHEQFMTSAAAARETR